MKSALETNWDTDLENIGLPSNLLFGFGSEFEGAYHRLQESPQSNIRWVVFKVTGTYYVIRQELVEGEWLEVWTNQRDRDLEDAKVYAESDYASEYFEGRDSDYDAEELYYIQNSDGDIRDGSN